MANKSSGQRPAVNRRKKYDPYYPTDYSVGQRQKPRPRPLVPSSPVLSPKKWFGMLFFGLIPLFNFIPLIAWARRKNPKTSENQKTFAKAAILLSVLFWIVAAGAGAALYFGGFISL